MIIPAHDKASDCHVHVFGERHNYPMAQDRHYTPDQANIQALHAHMQACAIQRVVLVQPSVYGSDNRCMLDAMASLGEAARGVAVIEPNSPPSLLEQLAKQKVIGLRLNLESSGQRESDQAQQQVAAWLPELKRLGMHLQVYAVFDTIVASLPWLDQLGIPIVLDHFAMIACDTPEAHPGIRAICDRLSSGQYYVKLSAPYRIAGTHLPQEQVTQLAQRLIQSNPQRCLWGSDWPHTNREPGLDRLEVSRFRSIPSDSLNQQWSDWMPDAITRKQILHLNPQELYGFPV